MPTQLQTTASLAFCERIKSDSAREYAHLYRDWLLSLKAATPEVPQNVPAMTAQRIRMQLKILVD